MFLSPLAYALVKVVLGVAAMLSIHFAIPRPKRRKDRKPDKEA